MSVFYPGAMQPTETPPEAGERFVVLRGNEVILTVEGRLPENCDWAAGTGRLRIGRLGEECCSCFSLPAEAGFPEGHTAVDARRALTILPEAEQTAFARARLLDHWRKHRRFCGKCSAALIDDEKECARRCPDCGAVYYPQVSPAVIVAVTDRENRLLLAHNSKFREGMYSLVAGFVEPGESMEAAVKRELREEVGLEVELVRYQGSQSWPFPDSLMVGFTARCPGGEIVPDGEEITDAGFFAPDEMPEIPGPGSISRVLIDGWLANYKKETV